MKLQLKNFRCFKDTGELELKKITLLVGENSSGKTSFLAALNHLGGLLSGRDIDLNTAPFELGAFKDIFYDGGNEGSSKKTSQQFEYVYKAQNKVHRYVFGDDQGDPMLKLYGIADESGNAMTCENKKAVASFRVSVSEEESKLLEEMGAKIDKASKGNDSIVTFQREIRKNRFLAHEKNEVHRINPMRIIEDVFFRSTDLRLNRSSGYSREEEEKMLQKRNLHDKFRPDVLPVLRDTTHFLDATLALAPLRTEPERIYSFSASKNRSPDGSHIPTELMRQDNLKDGYSEEFVKMLTEFGKDSGLFEKITIKKFDKNSNYPFSIMVKTAQGRESNIIDVGYGVSQILPVIYEIIVPDEYLNSRRRIGGRRNIRFLLQQPEVHLHPRGQAAFASLMVKLVKRNKSFVVETHSDFITERMKYEIEQGHISHEDVGILFFDTDDGETKIHQIDLGEDGLPENPPPSYRRFFLEELDRVWP